MCLGLKSLSAFSFSSPYPSPPLSLTSCSCMIDHQCVVTDKDSAIDIGLKVSAVCGPTGSNGGGSRSK